MRDRAIAIAIASMLVVGTLPVSAAAGGVPGRLLLNQDASRVATVELDDRTYRVYRYDNRLAYASGLAVYADGEQVTSERTVERVFTALARRRAAGEIGTDDLRSIRRIERNVSEAHRAATDALRELNGTLQYVQGLHGRTVNGTTAWALAVDAAPKLDDFNESARERREELRRFVTQSEDLVRDLRELAELIRRRQNGTDVPPRKLYQRYDAVLSSMEGLEEQVGGYAPIHEGLYRTANVSESIAENASSVPRIGGGIERRFSTLADASRSAGERIETLDDELGQSEIDEAQERVESLRSEWLAGWHQRRHATRDVYGTVFGLPLAAIGAVALGWRRWG